MLLSLWYNVLSATCVFTRNSVMDALETTPISSSPGTGGGGGGEGEGEKLLNVTTPTTGKEPLLGTHYHVRRGDNSWHVGEVIQRRTNFENGLTEYYVHYKDCEWSLWDGGREGGGRGVGRGKGWREGGRGKGGREGGGREGGREGGGRGVGRER